MRTFKFFSKCLIERIAFLKQESIIQAVLIAGLTCATTFSGAQGPPTCPEVVPGDTGFQYVAPAALDPSGVVGDPNTPILGNTTSMIDQNDNLWLFSSGSKSHPTAGTKILGDMWKFDTSENKWVNYFNVTASTPTNSYPATRTNSAGWIDSEGNPWIFGGGIPNSYGHFNDIFKFDVATKKWIYYPPVAGSQVPVTFNGTYWKNDAGKFIYAGGGAYYLLNLPPQFGIVYQYQGIPGTWEFDPDTLKWTRISSTTQERPDDQYLSSALPTQPLISLARWSNKAGKVWSILSDTSNPGARLEAPYGLHYRGLLDTDVYITANEDKPATASIPVKNLADGQNLLITTLPQFGTVEFESGTTNVIRYTPNPNYSGFDSLTVGVTNEAPGCAQTVVPVKIQTASVNDCPTASDFSIAGNYNSPTTIQLLAADTDSIPVLSVTQAPSHGQIQILEGNKVLYTPNNNYVGSDTLVYSVSDMDCSPIAVTVTIQISDAGATECAVNVGKDSGLITIAPVQDEMEPEITPAAPKRRNSMTAFMDSEGNPLLFGGHQITMNVYSQLNDLWKLDTATNQWEMLSANRASGAPPIRAGASGWADQNGNIWIFGGTPDYTSGNPNKVFNDLWKFNTATRIWSQESFSLGSAASYPPAGASSKYWISNTGEWMLSGGVTQEIDTTASGYPYVITYKVVNRIGTWSFNPANKTWSLISQTESQNPPADAYLQQTLTSLNAKNLISFGAWSDRQGKVWSFAGADGAYGITDLWYRDFYSKTMFININEDESGTASIPLKLANTADTLILSRPPSYGTVLFESGTTNSVRYTPNINYNGQDSFEVGVTNSPGQCVNSTVSVKVSIAPINDCPQVSNASETVVLNTPKEMQLPYSDPDSSPNVTISQSPQHGTLGQISNGKITYTPTSGYLGSDLFKFSVQESGCTAIIGTVSIQVTSLNLGGCPFNFGKDTDFIYLGQLYPTESSALDAPFQRGYPTSLVDGNANLWLFGGADYVSGAPNYTNYNDLWRFNTITNQWNRQFANSPTASTNYPSGRGRSSGWVDGSGNIWIYGGYIESISESTPSATKDMWKFDVAAKTWSKINYNLGNSASHPPADGDGKYWVNGSGEFMYSGGTFEQYDSLSKKYWHATYYGTWSFNPATNTWSLISSSSSTTPPSDPFYTQTIAKTGPPTKQLITSWSNGSNKVWVITKNNNDNQKYEMYYSGKEDKVTYLTMTSNQSGTVSIPLLMPTPSDVLTIKTAPQNGSALVHATIKDSIVYTPTPGFAGTDTFTVGVLNASNTCENSIALVKVTVSPAPGCPLAWEKNVQVQTNKMTSIQLPILMSDSSPELTVILPPSNGSLGVIKNNIVSYTPNSDFMGDDKFSVVVNGSTCSDQMATVNIDVKSNPVLSAVDDWDIYE